MEKMGNSKNILIAIIICILILILCMAMLGHISHIIQENTKKELCEQECGEFKSVGDNEYCFRNSKAIPISFDCEGILNPKCELYYIEK